MPVGSGLKTAGPPPLEASEGNQLEELQIQEQKLHLIVDSGLAAQVILSGPESAGTPHPC